MENEELNQKISSSIKWSSITEIFSKLVTPISSMILARLLSPEEFGVVATVTMITSFADVFTDAGFQKYLIQKNFKSEKALHESANVAFWTNISVSVFLWFVILVFCEEIANLVGNPGLGNVITIASISLILTSFSSIQTAIYKKKFDFKVLFVARMVGAVMPIIVTLPLAYLGFSYWAIIIGTLATHLSNAIILTIKSDWKPYCFFSIKLLGEMFSFSMWTLLESVLLWTTSYIGTFIVGRYLSNYYLGIYKNSISMVTSIMNIVAASTTSVLLSALAVAKNDKTNFDGILYSFQERVSLLLIPLGVGVFLYRDFVTNILFGAQWSEASLFVGLYSLAMAFSILTGQYISLTFTAKEKPKLSVLSQILQLIELLLLLIISVRLGFVYLVFARSIARVLFGVINMFIGKYYIGLAPKKMLQVMVPAFFGSLAMVAVNLGFSLAPNSLAHTILGIICCSIVYVGGLMMFKSSRTTVLLMFKKLIDVKKA